MLSNCEKHKKTQLAFGKVKNPQYMGLNAALQFW